MLTKKFQFALFVAVLLLATAAQAVPNLITYQGLLNDQNGVPVTGSVAFVFSIYTSSTGGTALWTESQTIAVSNGIFTAQLGSVTALPTSVFGTDVLYLGIKVGADAEMTPRQRITSSAYSHRAETITPPIVPIGGIVSWHKTMTGTPALAGGWVECNGQVLADPDSPYNGQTIPDLNGAKRILKGATASTGSITTEDFLPSHNHAVGGGGGGSTYFNWGGEVGWRGDLVSYTGPLGTPQTFFNVVWIMRVK